MAIKKIQMIPPGHTGATFDVNHPETDSDMVLMSGGGTLTTSLAAMLPQVIPHLGTTTNSGNNYSITSAEAITTNKKFTVKINATSTGTATLNVSSIGSAKGIKKAGGLDATLKIGAYTFFYDGSNFQLLGEGGDYGTATANKVLINNTLGTETGIVQGTMVDHTGGFAGTTNTASGGVGIDVIAPIGFYPGGQANLQISHADFIAANILSGKSPFGLVGTLVQGKGYASGSTTSNASGVVVVSGLTFLPSKVMIVAPTNQRWIFNRTWNPGFSFQTESTNILNSSSVFGSFSVGTYSNNASCTWEAYE